MKRRERLAAARGCLLGALLGAVFWAALAIVVVALLHR